MIIVVILMLWFHTWCGFGCTGYYEFIDVITEGSKLKNERLFVDIDFKAQFEIARPTNDYNALVQKIPNLFVGKADKLCGMVKIMCNAARKSLRERYEHSPWRKYRYMKAKWLGSYKRTTNPGSSGTLLQFPFSGIATRDRGWDGTIVRQMNKHNSATEVYVKAKSKCNKKGDEQVESCDRLSTREEQQNDVNKISALTTALADASAAQS